jgi:hypothetical protein
MWRQLVPPGARWRQHSPFPPNNWSTKKNLIGILISLSIRSTISGPYDNSFLEIEPKEEEREIMPSNGHVVVSLVHHKQPGCQVPAQCNTNICTVWITLGQTHFANQIIHLSHAKSMLEQAGMS